MKRAMRIRIIACLPVALALTAASSDAGIWAWGCRGQFGNQQLIFNRYSIFVLEGKKPLASIHKLTGEKIDDLIKGERTE
jgi:hypothetical protein